MRLRTLLVVFTVFAASVGLRGQSNPLFGAWKANSAKSKYVPGPPPRSQTLKYEADPQGMKHITDGVNAKGSPTHNEWVASFDGKDYPYQTNNAQAPADLTVALKKINERTTEVIRKEGGKVTSTFILKVSPDGKTLTRTSRDANGKPTKEVVVYDRQ